MTPHDVNRIVQRLENLETGARTRRERLKEDVAAAVSEAMDNITMPAPLTEEEHAWVKLAIRRESQSIALRQSIIEKSLTGLVLAAGGWAAVVIKDYLAKHGVKFDG